MKSILTTIFLSFSLFAAANNCDSLARNSTCKTYYVDGNLAEIHHFRKGQRHGIWVKFDQHKKRKQERMYKNGKLLWTKDYFEKNKVRIRYLDGKEKWIEDCGC